MAKPTPEGRGGLLKPAMRDLIPRGTHTPTPLGRFLYALFRLIDPVLQYFLLHPSYTTILYPSMLQPYLRRPSPSTSLPTSLSTGLPPLAGLPPARLALLLMSLGSAAKQTIWVLRLSTDPMPTGSALVIANFNTLFNVLDSVLYLARPSHNAEEALGHPTLLVGGALYVVGLLAEAAAEVQRKRFKADPRSKGKLYTGGLFGWVRHPNYGGYLVWRTGFALAAGGLGWAVVVAGFHFWDFYTRGVVFMDGYCGGRYGQQWTSYKERTKYKLIPFIY